MFSLQNFVRKDSLLSSFDTHIKLTDNDLNKIQAILLEMYNDILFVCEKNNLTLLLGGGSALGAIRHDGFIPWDDDMDLIMPREDYKIFVSLFKSEFSHKYYISSPFKEGDYPDYAIKIIKRDTSYVGLFTFNKLRPLGIFIDIVALDSVPMNYLKRNLNGSVANSLFFIINSIMMYYGKNKNAKKFFDINFNSRFFYFFRTSIIGAFFSLFSYSLLCRWFDWIITNKGKTNLCAIPSGRKHYFGEIHPFDVFFPAKKVCFAGVKAYLPNNVQRYLSNLYGNNFMEIPPQYKREPHFCTYYSTTKEYL
jgi:lipopolysaccharide cholinephosphotransferase